MTTPAMTDKQLIDYSGQHLMHELSMLWELAEILPGKEGSTETSAFVESFGIHLRNLIDFFYHRGNRDDVTAWDFIDATNTWKPKTPDTLNKAHRRVNKELSHLTQARISGSPPEKAWDTAALLKEIDAVAKKFAAKASQKKLHPKVLEFLQVPPAATVKWLSENVSHIIALTGASASTATVLPQYGIVVPPFRYSEEKKPGKG
jgi:hypothetical protein